MEVSVPKERGLEGTLDGLPERKISWLERVLSPEVYRVLRGLFTNPLSIAGFVIIGFFILMAVFAPLIAPPTNITDPYQIPRDGYSPDPRPPMAEWNRFQPPPAFWLKPLTGSEQWIHLLGTASGQWDIFYGVVWGTRTAFRVGVIITVSVVTIGILLGAISAYYGGVVDMVLMRITDVFMTMPFLIAALVLSSILAPLFGKSILAPTIALIVFGWMGYARLIRGDILSVKERDYVMAARVIGAKDRRIVFRHILPNAIFPTLVVASMDMGSYVITFAALSFLGIGAEVGYADWGQLLSFARDWITALDRFWYIVVFPGVALVLFVLSWNLIGDAARDIFDPHMRGRGGA
jgi:peptide/nickel transport system permease protein